MDPQPPIPIDYATSSTNSSTKGRWPGIVALACIAIADLAAIASYFIYQNGVNEGVIIKMAPFLLIALIAAILSLALALLGLTAPRSRRTCALALIILGLHILIALYLSR